MSATVPSNVDALVEQLQRTTIRPPQGGVERDASDGEDDGLPIGAEAAFQVRKTLVLLDFNDLLVHRDKKGLVKGVKPSFRDGTNRNTHNFYVRAGALELIAQLAQDPRCDYALYTSMKMHNMSEFVSAFDRWTKERGATLPTEIVVGGNSSRSTTVSTVSGSMMCIFDQPYNAPDPEGEDPWDTKRDLKKIFNAHVVKSRGYTAANTVLVECEWRKCRDWTANTLQPVPYLANDVMAAAGPNPPLDRELFELGDALQTLFARMQMPPGDATVPSIIAEHLPARYRPSQGDKSTTARRRPTGS